MLTELIQSIDMEAAQNFVSKAANQSIVDWTVKIAIVWVIMGRKVNERFTDFQNSLAAHFLEVENGFKNMVKEMKALKENVSADMAQTSTNIAGVKSEVLELKTRVTKLETKGV